MSKISLSLLLLSFAGLFSGLASGQIVSAPGQSALMATWHVEKYDMNVTLPQDDHTRSVDVRATVTVRNISGAPASSLTFRLTPQADVSAVRIGDGVATFSKSDEKMTNTVSFQKIAIRMPSVAVDGTVVASLDYKINVKENGPLASLSSAGSQFLPQSYWYPTPNNWFYKRGLDAAPVSLKITGPAGATFVAPGTGSAAGFENKLGGQPFFLAGSWDASELSGVTVYLPKGIGPDGQKRAADLAALFAEAKTFMSGVLGKAPDTPLRIVSSRRAPGFSECGTLIVDESVFGRPKMDALTAMNVAEAAARIWIGGSVYVGGDGYGVVSEGLTRYLAAQFIESKFGKDASDAERLRERVAYSTIADRDGPMASVAPIDDFYYSEVANKGAMAWRVLAKRVGSTQFSDAIKRSSQDNYLDLAELRLAFPDQKDLTDYFFDKVTDMDLLIGLPQTGGAEIRSAVRNTGSVDATVDVTATTSTGEKITAPVTVRATGLGDVGFKTTGKIDHVEIDPDKLYPQVDYSNDVAPRVTNKSDPLLAAKELLDKQDAAGAETMARRLLVDAPHYDDLRIILARALLAQNKTADAEREFKAALDEKLPTSRSMAWANVGLADIASRANQADAARRFADAAIAIDGDYGANLNARTIRAKLGSPAPTVDPSVKTFFADFDRAAAAERKADIDSMVLPGEISRFASGVAGSSQAWQTEIRRVDVLDASTLIVEVNLNIKLLNQNPQAGMAVFRLAKTPGGWKLAAVDMFEVH